MSVLQHRSDGFLPTQDAAGKGEHKSAVLEGKKKDNGGGGAGGGGGGKVVGDITEETMVN